MGLFGFFNDSEKKPEAPQIESATVVPHQKVDGLGQTYLVQGTLDEIACAFNTHHPVLRLPTAREVAVYIDQAQRNGLLGERLRDEESLDFTLQEAAIRNDFIRSGVNNRDYAPYLFFSRRSPDYLTLDAKLDGIARYIRESGRIPSLLSRQFLSVRQHFQRVDPSYADSFDKTCSNYRSAELFKKYVNGKFGSPGAIALGIDLPDLPSPPWKVSFLMHWLFGDEANDSIKSQINPISLRMAFPDFSLDAMDSRMFKIAPLRGHLEYWGERPQLTITSGHVSDRPILALEGGNGMYKHGEEKQMRADMAMRKKAVAGQLSIAGEDQIGCLSIADDVSGRLSKAELQEEADA